MGRCFVMRISTRSLLTLSLSVGVGLGAASAQLLPEPRDGDIRVVYWDLRSETEVFLTLELRSPSGEKLPLPLTLRVTFPGKRPAAPVTDVQVRAYVGNLWAPEPRLTMVVDGREAIGFAPPPSGMYSWDSGTLMGIVGTISIATLNKMASARSVGGNVLGLKFELIGSQREALARFAERVQSPDPGLLRGVR